MERAAQRHGLRPEPWFKDVALWALHFRHPKGGTGQIVVGRRDRGYVDGYWWRDDFARETRHIAPIVHRDLAPMSSDLEPVIREVLGILVALSDGDLINAHPMPPGTWHRYFTEESFDAWERSLPVPRL